MKNSKLTRYKGSIYSAFTLMIASFGGILGELYFNFVIGFVIFGAVCLKFFAVKRLYDSDRLFWSE